MPALLKWPNDVLVHDRKVAGVLCEVDDPGREPTLLIGIGINCNFERAELPEEVTEQAETLQSVAGRPIDREALFEAIVAGLVRAVESPRPLREIARAASDRLARRGEQTDVTTPDGARLRGRLLGLDDAGRARLETEAGEVTLPSGAAFAEQAEG